MSAENQPGQDDLMVPIDWWLEALIQQPVPKPTRSREEIVLAAAYKRIESAKAKLLRLRESRFHTGSRAQKIAIRSQDDIKWGIRRLDIWRYDEQGLTSVFEDCTRHFAFFHDPKYNNWYRGFYERAQTDRWFKPLAKSPDQLSEQPDLSHYQSDLPLELRDVLRFYVAAHFIPRADLQIPPEVDILNK